MKNPSVNEQTNFDLYLEEHPQDPDFEERFRKAGEMWDFALRIAAQDLDSGDPHTDREGDRRWD
jgi:hypothetical protein